MPLGVEIVCQMAADESGSTCDQDSHILSASCSASHREPLFVFRVVYHFVCQPQIDLLSSLGARGWRLCDVDRSPPVIHITPDWVSHWRGKRPADNRACEEASVIGYSHCFFAILHSLPFTPDRC